MMFGSIIYSGFYMISKRRLGKRNMKIMSLSLSIGLGFSQVPAVFNVFPGMVKTVFAENCVAIIFILALLLDLVLPEEKEDMAE